MINKVVCFLILFTSFSFFGQNARFDIYNNTTGFLYFAQDVDKQYENVEGSPYVDSKFYASQVIGISGPTPPIRYNAYKDELEFVDRDKTYYVSKSDSLEVKLSNKSYKYLEYQIDNRFEMGFLVVLLNDINGKFSLYKKEKITLVPKYDSGSGYRDAVPAHFKLEEEKFYIGFSKKISSVSKKEKDIISLLPDYSQELKKFIKENKISFKNEDNLLRLVKFMNTLK